MFKKLIENLFDIINVLIIIITALIFTILIMGCILAIYVSSSKVALFCILFGIILSPFIIYYIVKWTQ